MLWQLAGWTQTLTTFQDGEPARASEVNDNFAALKAKIEALEQDLEALTPFQHPDRYYPNWRFELETPVGVVAIRMLEGCQRFQILLQRLNLCFERCKVIVHFTRPRRLPILEGCQGLGPTRQLPQHCCCNNGYQHERPVLDASRFQDSSDRNPERVSSLYHRHLIRGRTVIGGPLFVCPARASRHSSA